MVHPVRHTAQRCFPQRRQLIHCKEILQGAFCLYPAVYLPFSHAFDQLFRFNVHKLYLICPVKDAVGDPLLHLYRRDAGDIVVQTLQMLYIYGRIDVDPVFQQLLDILISFFVTASLHIRMSQLIYEKDLRSARQRGVQIKFPYVHAFVLFHEEWNVLQSLLESSRLRTRVGLDIPRDHVYVIFPEF